jgi:tetratricopeptide (TPR) repeat protein
MMESELCTSLEIRQNDVLMLGRHDGIDVLSLGPAFLQISSLSELKSATLDNVGENTSDKPWADWARSSTGTAHIYDEKAAIRYMLRSASGQSIPDIVLEGFCKEDRWILRLESGYEKELTGLYTTPIVWDSTHSAQSFSMSSSNDGGSPLLPVVKFWSRLWGSDSIPETNLPTMIKYDNNNNKTTDEDPILDLAAQNSVPIDVDDDTFIVSKPQHMNTIHAIASVPISTGQFSAGIHILTKMLHGLGGITQCEDLIKENMRGATLCNIGLLHLWRGEHEEACEFFRLASEARKACPIVTKHDRIVPLVRHGQALFAMKQFSASLRCYEEALGLTDHDADELLRAKVLVNAGVSSFRLDDFSQSLESFTQALTIQRKWLDRPIRRRGLVRDASITLSNIGKLYLERGDANMASVVYEEALLLEKSILGKAHPFLISSLQNLAFAKARELQYGKAIALLEKCRRLQGKYFETSTATPIMDTCGWMAHLYAHKGQTAQAKCLYETVNAWQKTFLPPKHPDRQHIEICLQRLHCTTPATATSWL